MSDLISREEAIDAMDDESVSTNPTHFKSNEKFIEFMDDADIASFGWWQWANGFSTALVKARMQLEELPSVQQWIPCSERLPKESGAYLCWGNINENFEDTQMVLEFNKDEGEFGFLQQYFDPETLAEVYSEFVSHDIKAWMPLPKAYKESEGLGQEIVLDKIRAEIDSALSKEVISDNRQQISDVGIGLELALSIINKYKESEE